MSFWMLNFNGFLWVAMFLGLAVPVQAQQADLLTQQLERMVGTLDVTMQPFMSGGQLNGCTLVFNALYRDYTYRNGGFLRVTGNVGLMAMGGTLGSTLKVVVLELDPKRPDLGLVPSPPSRAYIQGADYSTNLSSLVDSSESDTPGALFSVFQFSPTFQMVMEGLERNQIVVMFNSMGGSTDIRLPIELDVVDFKDDGSRVRSTKAKEEFLACNQALVNTLR